MAPLAWWRGTGHATVTRAQLAAKAGWKAKGSHLRNRLSELRAIGMIEYRSGAIALTPAGNAVAPQPDLGVSLVDSIRAALNSPHVRCSMLSSSSALEAPRYSPGTNWLNGSVGT